MNNHTNIPDVDDGLPRSESAISIYGQNDALDDFPVLKAFQQYIDAEQNKARKRLVMLCVFFGFMMTVIVAVFVVMLQNVNLRNQTLNDRLVEYAMKDRDRPSPSPVVVQSSPPQDNSVLIALTAKLEALQRQISDNEMKSAQKAAAEKAAEKKTEQKKSAAPPSPSVEEIERERKYQSEKAALERDRLLLKIELDKLAEEKERLRKEEVERNRRRIYADYYEKKKPKEKKKANPLSVEVENFEKELELDDDSAIEYFKPASPSPAGKSRKSAEKKLQREQPEQPERKIEDLPAKEYFDIPVDVKGSSTSWSIPGE